MSEGGPDLLPRPNVPDLHRVISAGGYHNAVCQSTAGSKLRAGDKILMNALKVRDDFASLRRPYSHIFVVTSCEHVLINRNVHVYHFIGAFVNSYFFCIHLVPVSDCAVIRARYNLLSAVVE